MCREKTVASWNPSFFTLWLRVRVRVKVRVEVRVKVRVKVTVRVRFRVRIRVTLMSRAKKLQPRFGIRQHTTTTSPFIVSCACAYEEVLVNYEKHHY